MTEVQYIDLVCISMRFSYDTDLRHERVKYFLLKLAIILDFEKVSKFIWIYATPASIQNYLRCMLVFLSVSFEI